MPPPHASPPPGGKTYRPPQDIPGVGRFAVMADPHGATFMLFRGATGDAPPAAAPGTPGHVGWHELHAGDGAAAFAFYAGQFGWEKHEAMDMGPVGRYQMFGLAGSGNVSMGGMMTKMPETPRPHWLYYFNVEAIDAAVDAHRRRRRQGRPRPAGSAGRELDRQRDRSAGRAVRARRAEALRAALR